MTISHLLIFLSLILLLSACAPFKFNNDKAAMCNELNSKIIFNGATTNVRNSEIQQAEMPLMQQSYLKDCE